MNKKILISGSLLGLSGILLGAFGAHGLKALLSESSINTFETGVRYQIYHALFLLFVGSSSLITQKTKRLVFYLILIGILFFSGSIYGLSTNQLTNFNFKRIALITPIGGLFLLCAWGFLFMDLIKIKTKK